VRPVNRQVEPHPHLNTTLPRLRRHSTQLYFLPVTRSGRDGLVSYWSTDPWWNMSDSSVAAAAKCPGFLTGLEPSAVQAILAAGQVRRVPAKHNITSGGSEATHLYLLQSGRARYYHLTRHGEAVLLAWLASGDVIGLVALLKTSCTYMGTAEAASDCELLTWERPVLRQLVSRYPVLSENGLHIALAYLRRYVARHVGLVTRTAEERLADVLLKLGRQSGEVHADGIEIQITNDQLGALADTSPFTASRVLNNWVRGGALSKGRGRVLLHAPEALMID